LRLAQWRKKPLEAGVLLTSVGRITEQKVLLLRQCMADGRSALEALLDTLGAKDRLLMLGSGDRALEDFFMELASRRDNFLFLNGYAESLPDSIYAAGDLFLMPSSFEPCGISQMLAMRAGQPCLVHGVGGLLDTVHDDMTGFVFTGSDLNEQVSALQRRLQQILTLRSKQPARWRKICKLAEEQRFLWQDAAQDYLSLLYEHADDRHAMLQPW
jgi:starch synthase